MINLPDAYLAHVCEILEYLLTLEKRDKFSTIQDIHDFFKKTNQYTKKAISFLLFFKIIHEDANFIKINKEVYKNLDGSRERSVLILKGHIIKFKPYVEYYYFISIKKSEEDSAKLIQNIYNIKQDSSRIITIFNKWSNFLNIKHENNPTEFSNELSLLSNSINNEMLIQKFLREQFGNHYNKIGSYVIADLVEALKDYKINSRKSINDAGRAMEDFLRLDFSKSISLEHCSGIVQIANELNRYTISTKKHNGIVIGLGNIRSMGDAHGADKKEGERWIINEYSALFYTLLVIKTIVSILEYQNNHNLIF